MRSSSAPPVCRTFRSGGWARLVMQPGFYAYVGSALGPGGLKARVNRHLQPAARLHWHIDYLRQQTEWATVWYAYGSVRQECAWAAAFSSLRGSTIPLRGFGSSDCGCPAHLYFFDRMPLWPILRSRRAAKHLSKTGNERGVPYLMILAGRHSRRSGNLEHEYPRACGVRMIGRTKQRGERQNSRVSGTLPRRQLQLHQLARLWVPRRPGAAQRPRPAVWGDASHRPEITLPLRCGRPIPRATSAPLLPVAGRGTGGRRVAARRRRRHDDHSRAESHGGGARVPALGGDISDEAEQPPVVCLSGG